MPNNTTTQLNVQVRELLDSAIAQSFPYNTQLMSKFKRTLQTEKVTNIGRYFTIKTGSNESYGSPSEGGAFPATGRLTRARALVNYRNQFKSFGFSGEVEDLATNNTLRNELVEITQDATKQFDETQEFFAFGTGTGELARIDSVAGNDITCLNNVTYSHGANYIRQNQLLNAYDISGAAYRVGDMTVNSKSSDVVTVDAAAAAIAADDDDILVYKSSYNLAPQGLPYHVADSGTWLGLSRATYPTLKAVVQDAASASIDFDMIEIADAKSRNVRGDAMPKFGALLVMNPHQHKNLRSLARSAGNIQFNMNATGGNKGGLDLLVADTTPGGQSIVESYWCPPSDVYGLRTEDWCIEEVAPRQLYKHNNGDIFIQEIASSTAYGDAKQGRVYWRYNLVCKAPWNQYRIKNVNYTASECRNNRP